MEKKCFDLRVVNNKLLQKYFYSDNILLNKNEEYEHIIMDINIKDWKKCKDFLDNCGVKYNIVEDNWVTFLLIYRLTETEREAFNLLLTEYEIRKT